MAIDTRPLGDTGRETSRVVFGAIALDSLDQDAADDLAADVLDAGVNHVDVAPTYGDAERKLAPTLADRRDEVFLGCKTLERTYYGAWGELHRSLDRLGVDSLDLYQFHAVTGYDELDAIAGAYSPEMAQDDDPGALAAFREAREEGLVSHLGLTSHGDPSLIRAAIDRVPDLETVMAPYNLTLAAKDGPEHDYGSVFDLARERDLGTLGIKAVAKGEWPEDLPREDRPYDTWYEPYDDPDAVEERVRFALSGGPTRVVTPGDPDLVRPVLEAADGGDPMDDDERATLLERTRDDDPDTPVPTR